MKLNCKACGSEGTMLKGSISRFGIMVTLIGVIIAIPSGLIFLVTAATAIKMTTMVHGVAAYIAIAGPGLIVAAGSLVIGGAGWLLLDNRKVYLCTECGHWINRH